GRVFIIPSLFSPAEVRAQAGPSLTCLAFVKKRRKIGGMNRLSGGSLPDSRLTLSQSMKRLGIILIVAFTFPLSGWRAGQGVRTDMLAGLSWRNLGPFRAGRVSAVSGAIGQPGTFYAGSPMGGVWKTTSAGETWSPVFDSVKEASSVGALAVAPSNPDVIYVGMGDLIAGGPAEGNGVYKSIDAGRTWQHLGLD